MAVPNGLNPSFQGVIKAAAVAGKDLNGEQSVNRSTSGTSVVNLFGTTVGFSGTITSFHIIAEGGLNSTITLSMGGLVISTILQGTTTRAMLGPTTPFTSTTFTAGQTIGIYSSSALAQGKAKAFVTFSAKHPTN